MKKKILSKILNKILKKMKSNHSFPYSFDEQVKLIETLKMGRVDDKINRSYLQFEAQTYGVSFFYICFINVIALPFLLSLIPLLMMKRIGKQNRKAIEAVNFGVASKIPINLESITIERSKGKRLDCEDIKFIFRVFKRFPFSYFFLLKTIIKISEYSFNIIKYNGLKKILCSNEFSFTSSILTEYCNIKGIKHINFMHGEKIFDITDSFCSYDTFYVWDEYYIELFYLLNADVKEYIVKLPKSIEEMKKRKINEGSFIKYYLQGIENLGELNQIKEVLEKISKKEGCQFYVRLHPIYSKVDEISKVFKKNEIEKNINFEESILSSKYIIAKNSTVLFEGMKIGKTVIIDDMSNPLLYKKSKDLKYIMCEDSKALKLNEFISGKKMKND